MSWMPFAQPFKKNLYSKQHGLNGPSLRMGLQVIGTKPQTLCIWIHYCTVGTVSKACKISLHMRFTAKQVLVILLGMTALCIPGWACSFSALLASSHETPHGSESLPLDRSILSHNKEASDHSGMPCDGFIQCAASIQQHRHQPTELALLLLCACPYSHTAHKSYFEHCTHVHHTHAACIRMPNGAYIRTYS